MAGRAWGWVHKVCHRVKSSTLVTQRVPPACARGGSPAERSCFRRQHALRRIALDERICIEVRGDNVRPLIEDSVQPVVVLDIKHRDRTPSGARVDVPAYPARLVFGNPGPERLASPDQIGRPLGPRNRLVDVTTGKTIPRWRYLKSHRPRGDTDDRPRYYAVKFKPEVKLSKEVLAELSEEELAKLPKEVLPR